MPAPMDRGPRTTAGADAWAPGSRPGQGTDGDTIVVGLGNPILGDDGVGWRVVAELEQWGPHRASLQQACVGGIGLMELLVGYRHAIIVDAITDPAARPGSVWYRPLSEVVTHTASHLDSSHDASLRAALQAGQLMGATLPSDVDVVGIVIERGDVFGEQLSEAIEEAVPTAVALVRQALRSRPARPLRDPVHA